MTPETARPFTDIHAPVAKALAAGKPVVALESTIITHGMPYPDNAAMATNVEKIIADGGAVPATIAVVDGRLKIGLSNEERENAGEDDRRDEAVARRSWLRGGGKTHRRHHCRGNDDRRAYGRHQGFRNWRHRRRAQGRRKELRHFRRPRRTGAHAGDRGFSRRQGDPRHREDAGSAGDARRAGGRLRLRRDAGLLVACLATQGAAQARRCRADRRIFQDTRCSRPRWRHAGRQPGAGEGRDTGCGDGRLHRRGPGSRARKKASPARR